jgi:hypothetical protein
MEMYWFIAFVESLGGIKGEGGKEEGRVQEREGKKEGGGERKGQKSIREK